LEPTLANQTLKSLTLGTNLESSLASAWREILVATFFLFFLALTLTETAGAVADS